VFIGAEVRTAVSKLTFIKEYSFVNHINLWMLSKNEDGHFFSATQVITYFIVVNVYIVNIGLYRKVKGIKLPLFIPASALREYE
jgi:hypothetical protein